MEGGKIQDIFSDTESVVSNSKKESQPSIKEKKQESSPKVTHEIPRLNLEDTIKKERPSDRLLQKA